MCISMQLDSYLYLQIATTRVVEDRGTLVCRLSWMHNLSGIVFGVETCAVPHAEGRGEAHGVLTGTCGPSAPSEWSDRNLNAC
jgi:hypothetical protein